MTTQRDRPASRTAVLVAQARAVADGRILPGRFSDPIAIRLLDDAEGTAVERARDDAPPPGVRGRLSYEFLRATAEHMAVRTVLIDDAIRAAATSQVVLLGAGLDARAWRLAALSATTLFEVDHPASQADKRRRVAGLEPMAEPRYVAVDLATSPLAPALEAAGFDPTMPTTWVWEGVVMYLTPAAVESTVAQVATLSPPGSRLVVNYSVPSWVGRLVRLTLGRLSRLARGEDPFADEPNRSAWTPETIGALLRRHGFGVETDVDLATGAERLGLATEYGARLRTFRVVVAHR